MNPRSCLTLMLLLCACAEQPTAPLLSEPPAAQRDWLFPNSGAYFISNWTYGGFATGHSISPDGHWATGETTDGSYYTAFRANLSVNPLTTSFVNLGPSAGVHVQAYAINDYGYMAGRYSFAYGVFWSSPGSYMYLLAAPGEKTTPFAMTNTAPPVLVGVKYDGANVPHPVIWVLTDLSASYGPAPIALPETGGTRGIAYGVNAAANAIVGYIEGASGKRATRWSLTPPYTAQDLGIAGIARDVNSNGDIVGGVTNGPGFIKRASGTSYINLGANTMLYGVNDQGFAVGGHAFGFIWSGVSGEAAVQVMNGSGVTGSALLDISNNNKAVGYAAYDGSYYYPYGITFSPAADDDDDGIANGSDKCPNRADPDQADVDGDGIGDYCDADHVPVITSATSNRSSAAEGYVFRFVASAFDPGARRIFYRWDFADGTYVNGRSAEKAFNGAGPHTAVLTVRNNVTPNTTAEVIVATTNAVPTALAGGGLAESGLPFTLAGTLNDAGPPEELDVSIDWGDGSLIRSLSCTSPCTLSEPHAYYALRTFRPNITVVDADGASRSVRATVTVIPRAVVATIQPDAVIDLDHDADLIRITLFGSATFATAQIKRTSVTVTDGTGTPLVPVVRAPAAADGDAYHDRVLEISMLALYEAGNLTPGTTTQLVITGRLTDGSYFTATIGVSVVS